MQNVQNRLFRKVALDRLSSPEQLDQLMQITSPRAWLALIAITILLVTAGLWAVFGSISEEVQANGVFTTNSEIVAYVKLADSAELQRGMQVEVEVSSVDTEKYGYFKAVITEIGQTPVSRQRVAEEVGSQELATAIVPDDLAIAVYVRIKHETVQSGSGYRYQLTSGEYFTELLREGTPVTAVIIVDEKRPIGRVFPMFE
jgi:hypothetical protein